jgi:hypothetical protein
MNNSIKFDLDETKIEADIKPLINEPYSFENMVNHPIIRPIAETDKGIRDLEEIKIKLLIDLGKEKDLINQELLETPEYNDINFVGNLLRMVDRIVDILKIDSLERKKYEDCIREINNLVRTNYGTRASNGDLIEPLTVDHLGYLNKLSTNTDKVIIECAAEILKDFESSQDPDVYKRFEDSCTRVFKNYKDAGEKEKMKVVAKIMRMQV